MDTLTKSCSPTILVTANGEVQTHEEATVYVKELVYSWRWNSSRIRQQYCRLESFAMKTDILMNGSMVKNHISLRTGFWYNATRRTSFLSWLQACQRVLHPVLILQLRRHYQDKRVIILHLLQARLLQWQHHQETMRFEIELKVNPLQWLCQVSMLMIEITSQFTKPTKNFQTNWRSMTERRNPLSADSGRASSEIQEWLHRRRNGGAVPRAEIFCDLITADHKVLSDNCEFSKQSPMCSRGAGFGHPMDPVVSVQNKNFSGNPACKNSWSQRGSSKSSTLTILEFGKDCEDLSWNHCTSTPHRSETNGIAERAVRRVIGRHLCGIVTIRSEWKLVGRFYQMLHLSATRHRSVIWWEGALWKMFGQPFEGPIISFGSLVEYHPFTAKDQSRIHQFGKQVLLGLFLGYVLYAGGIWKGDVLAADIEELETMDWNLLEKTQCKRGDISQRKRKIYFPIADGRIKTLGGDQDLRTSTSIRHRPIQEESYLIFLENKKGLFHHFTTRSGCRWSNKWLLVHVRKLVRREKNLSLFHWNTLTSPEHYLYEFGCQARETHRWLLEYRWVKRFVWLLDRFHTICSLGRKPTNGYMRSGERLTRKQLTSRPDHWWPELWKSMGKHAKLKEKQKWSDEKLHLENARKLRGIYFIDPEDKEFKETIKNARKKLETSVAPAMPCKNMKNNKNCGSGASNKIENKTCVCSGSEWINKTAYGRIIADSSWRTYCRKRRQFTAALQFGSQIYSYASSCEIFHSKGSSGQGMAIIGENFGVELDKGQKLERGDRWSKDEGRKNSFRFTDGHMSFEKCWAPKIQRSSCSPRWYCKRRFGVLCSIHWTRIISITNDSSKSHGYHLHTAWSRRTSSWRSICLYPGENGGCTQIIENSQIGMSRHLDSSTTTQMAWIMVQFGRPIRSAWTKSARSSFGRTTMGKAIWENPIEAWLGENSNWECLFVQYEKGLFLSVCVDDIKLAGKKQNVDLMWKVLNKEVYLGEPTSFLDHVYLGCTQRQCKISKDIVDNYRAMFESRMSAVWTEKLPYSEIFRVSSWFYDMEGHAKKCVERYCELANRTTQHLYKVSTPCIDDHHFTEEEMKSVGKLSQVCSCSEMLALGRDWKTWYSMVSEQICTIDYQMDQSLWQTPESIDIFHSSHMWIQTILLCGKHSTTMQTGIVSRLWLLQEILRTPNLLQVEHCAFSEVIYLFRYVGCVRNKLQFRTVQQNQKSSLWMQDWGWMVYPLSICGIWLFLSLETQFRLLIERWDPLFALKRFTNASNLEEWSMIWIMLIFSFKRPMFASRSFVVCVWGQRSSDQDDYKRKSHNETCFQDPQSCAWLVIRSNQFGRKKIQIKHIDTKNQLADIPTKGNFTRDEWNHLLCIFKH